MSESVVIPFFSVGWQGLLLITALLFGSQVLFGFIDANQDEGIPLFPGGQYVLGILCGLACYFAAALNPTVQALEVGVVLYWLWKGKIDCRGHVLGVLGIIASVLLPLTATSPRGIDIFSIFLAYALLDMLKQLTRRQRWLQIFFAHHLHFHLIAISYAIYCLDALAYVALLSNLAGTYLVYAWLARRRR